MAGKKEHPYKPHHWDADVLREAKYFEVVLESGERFKAKLLGINEYNMLLETEEARIFLPKHSIRYVVLERFVEEEDDEA
ncbi:hypothetical protein Adeg_2164 (plasmid) [Ammonifex degensii KC4]|uniref:DUF2187 domain-containing protein n=1 Tax=Ammonifex degensii (strain DSM 10501 / KC4) TaxID=429009 RepID=C9RDH0_AMMDK|nr:hypothetical protein [Ammonifex degensii]ACX53241.1 hypothetical protein Adeg_2164 [Ammonifex degensii KC4]